MQGFFNKNYPFDISLRKRFAIALWTSLGIFLFILFFQPFGIVVGDMNNYLLLIAGFAGISIILQLSIHLSIPIGRISQKPDHINHNILLLFEILIWILSSVAFSFYLRYVGKVNLSIFLVFRIVIVCLLVPVANMLVYEIYDLRLKLGQKDEKDKDGDNIRTQKVLEHIVEIKSANRTERLKISLDRLLFVKSSENYVEVHYLDKGEPKMKLLRTTLKAIEDLLNPYPQVMRCHRKYLINLSIVAELKRSKGVYTLAFSNHSEELPVSRQYLINVKDAIENMM